jgi:hypothetical protein
MKSVVQPASVSGKAGCPSGEVEDPSATGVGSTHWFCGEQTLPLAAQLPSETQSMMTPIRAA